MNCGCFYDVYAEMWTQRCGSERCLYLARRRYSVEGMLWRAEQQAERASTPLDWTWLHGGNA